MIGPSGESADTLSYSSADPSTRSTLRTVLFGTSGNVLHQFTRYWIVGGLAFVVDFGSLYLLTEFAGLHYLVSAAVAFLFGLVTNYLLSRAWVFDRRTMDTATAEFAIFTMIGLVGLGLNEVIIWSLREKGHLHYLLSKAIASAIVLIWNFGARKVALFSERPLAAGVAQQVAVPAGQARWSAWVGAAYFLFCLLVQASTGAWQAAFAAYPDEPAHFVGAVMIRDWLLSGRWTTPLQFAQDYYSHYPYVALGYWPPAFDVVTGLEFLVLGVGRMQALLVTAACAAAGAWLLFRLLSRRVGLVVAACAGTLYLCLPAVQRCMCAVMVDHMTACLCIAASVWLLRYLQQPGYRNGIFLAALCTGAILSKYSAAYIVLLPMAAILLFGRGALLRKPSFLIQPLVLALLIGPWALWTRELTFHGLPSKQPALTANRAASFVVQTFEIFPPVLMAVVILGLLALLVLPAAWRKDIGVVALLCVGHLSFLFFSPVLAEPRYLFVPAASLLVLSFAGWAAALQRTSGGNRYAGAVSVSVVLLTTAFALVYFGRYPRPPQYPIRSIVEVVLRNKAWAGQRLLVPSDLEGPFIAEFVAQERSRPALYLLRPSKILASSDWFGGNYAPFFRTPEQMLEYFRENPVKVVIWHQRPEKAQDMHERLLGDMLQRNPLFWRIADSGAAAHTTPSWAVYEFAQLPESR